MNLFQAERFAEDAFRVKRAYIDAAGDLVAGILLGQLVYWFMPDHQGRRKVTLERDGDFWLAKGRGDWWDEIRISPKQYDRAIKILEDKGFVTLDRTHFQGKNLTHIRLNETEVYRTVTSNFPDGELLTSPMGDFELPQKDNSSIQRLHTEITTKTTTARGRAKSSSVSDSIQDLKAGKINADGITAQTKSSVSDADVFDSFFRCFGAAPNALQLERLNSYLDDDGFEPALLVYLFERTALNGKGFTYTEGALRNIGRRGIFTLEDYEKDAAERRARHDGGHRRNPEADQAGGDFYKHENADFSDVDFPGK